MTPQCFHALLFREYNALVTEKSLKIPETCTKKCKNGPIVHKNYSDFFEKDLEMLENLGEKGRLVFNIIVKQWQNSNRSIRFNSKRISLFVT